MRIVEVTKTQYAAASAPTNCIYCDPRWLAAVEEVYPHLAVHRLACLDGESAPLWLLPVVAIRPLLARRPIWINVAFANCGGFVLLRQCPPEEWTLSLSALSEFFLQSTASALEVRGHTLGGAFTVVNYYKRFVLDLPSSARTVWDERLASNARSRVRKAQRCGVITEINPHDGLSHLEHLYERHAADHGTPMHSPAWLAALSRYFHDESFIIIAHKNGAAVGAAFIIGADETVFMHTVVADMRLPSLGTNEILYWAAIEESIRRGKRRLDFGRTRPVPGQLFFKRKWGAREESLTYSYLLKPGCRPPLLVPEKGRGRLAAWLWRRLPFSLQRRFGPRLRVRITA